MTRSRPVLYRLLAERTAFLKFLEVRLQDSDLAEEILQESFTKAVERAESVRSEEAASAWFYRVLRNAIIDHSRRTAAADRRLVAYARELQDATRQTQDQVDHVCQCVSALIPTLKPEYATAIQRVDLEEESLADYADGVGITANNAGVRVHRARRALRKKVLGFCGSCADHGCVDCSCRKPPYHSADLRVPTTCDPGSECGS